MRKIKICAASVTVIYILFLLPSCSTPRAGAQKTVLQVPGAYAGNTDSSSTEKISWQSLFEDEVLKSLIDTAVKNNLDLQNTLEYISIARANLLFNKGLGLPSLDGFVSAAADKYGKYTMTGVGNFDTNLSPNITEDQKVGINPTQDYFLGLKSSWEIDIWGKLKSRRKAAASRLLATEQGRQWAITQLVTQVATYYFELLAMDAKLEIIRRNIALQEHSVEVVQVMKEGGRATSLAVQQFTAQLLQTRSLEHETILSIIRLENELNTLLGRFPAPIPRGSAINEQNIPQTIAAGIPADLLRKRPDILEAELMLEASHANTDAARKAFFPSLTLTPYLALNAFKLPLVFAGGSLTYGLLGGITQPIFNRYQLKADFAVANAEQNIAFNTYQKTILQGYQEVLSSLKAIEQYKKVVDLNNEEVQTLTEAVKTSNDLYFGGYAGYLEVVTAQKGVLDAELNKTMSHRSLLLSILDTYRALGGGW
ncbi:MAG: efflux transporter outer membrane subunit [Chitinophagaceae bacterium]|nr:efflux transporter outer membrane subunit [Chitinophagaceae bacterium]MCW5929314.1 efflux transporter outer membrane subunit [Chitinophagaceae bacterium]